MKILVAPHPMLHTVCRSDFNIDYATIHVMFATMRESGGLGQAAPQVGIDARVFVTGWGEVFVNPVIDEEYVGTVLSTEGCLSLPGTFVRVARRSHIRMSTGQWYAGHKAIVIQHELDHLNGILITD